MLKSFLFLNAGEALQKEQNKMLDELLLKDFTQDIANEDQCLVLSNKIPILEFDTLSKVHSRQDISNIICKEPVGDEELYKTLVNEWLHPCKPSWKQCIAIVGQAQIGKTYILKQLLSHLRKNLSYQYIFYVSLKSINFSDEMNILQLLTQQSGQRWLSHKTDQDFQLFKRVVETLHDGEKEQVCIIFDDLENFSYKNYNYSKSIFDNMTAGYLVSNTIRKWFRNGQKIVLLSPLQYSELIRVIEPEPLHVIHVQGINYAMQKHLLGNKAVKCHRANCKLKEACLGKLVTEHDDECHICKRCHQNNCHFELQSLCFNPHNFFDLVSPSKNFPPSTLVKIAASILVEKLISAFGENFEKAPNFQLVSRFAWEQYAKRVFVFYKSDLLRFEFSTILVNMFFSAKAFETSLQLSPHPDFVFFFSHILFQELLAALWLLSLSTNDFNYQVNNNKKLFLNGDFDVVFDFMCEISEDEQLHIKFGKIPKDNFEVLKEVLGKYWQF